MNETYEYVMSKGHRRANKDGYVYKHILVAEQKLGRPLKDEEVVHHIDGNRRNNDPVNLMVFATNSDHVLYHKGHEYVEVCGVCFCINESRTQNATCTICGNDVYADGNMCRECRAITRRIVQRPSRQELKELIRNNTFVFIANRFNVTDNTIRKWCKYYNLPSKATIIKGMSDQQWAVA